MSDDGGEGANAAGEVEALHIRNQELERRLNELQDSSNARALRAELKAEAIRAGMIDLDGLKLVDDRAVNVDEAGEVQGARAAISQLRRNKPWLFGHQNSSSVVTPPTSAAAGSKSATDMTLEEWRAARAELVRRR